MLTCSEHTGAVVVYIEGKCPVCGQMAFVREFEVKLRDMERDITAMKAKNKREIQDMSTELLSYVARPRI